MDALRRDAGLESEDAAVAASGEGGSDSEACCTDEPPLAPPPPRWVACHRRFEAFRTFSCEKRLKRVEMEALSSIGWD